MEIEMASIARTQKDNRQLWALVPFRTNGAFKHPVFFCSEDEVRLCWSTPIFVSWGESKELETREDWLKAIASKVPVPLLPSSGEELIQAFSKPKPPKTSEELRVAMHEQWLAARNSEDAAAKLEQYVLNEYGFVVYRLYLSTDRKRSTRILRKRGSAAFLWFMNWQRYCLNPREAFVNIPAPVHNLSADSGPTCNLRLRDYIHLDALNQVPADVGSLIESTLANPTNPYMYCLNWDWAFDEIGRLASRSRWHQAPECKLIIENFRLFWARIVLELDDALRSCRPRLSAKACQAFWTSWEVREHLNGIETKVNRYASQPGAVLEER
jgi:hypothetical protein